MERVQNCAAHGWMLVGWADWHPPSIVNFIQLNYATDYIDRRQNSIQMHWIGLDNWMMSVVC